MADTPLADGHARTTCRLFHDWSKWATFETGEVERAGTVIGRYEVQKRECHRCGQVQLQQVRSY